jgi:hypothetical protein
MVTRIDDRRKNKRYRSTASDEGITRPITDNIANDKPIVRNEVFRAN